jgi:hypothetical protein
MTTSVCSYNIPDGVFPDLIFYNNANNVNSVQLSKNDPITNTYRFNDIYADFECKQKIGYNEYNAFFNKETSSLSGFRTIYLPQGTITFNSIVKNVSPNGTGLNQTIISEIISGTGDFLGSKGFCTNIFDDPIVNPIRILYIYFEKCKK